MVEYFILFLFFGSNSDAFFFVVGFYFILFSFLFLFYLATRDLHHE